jgi:hypothetical protein
MAPEDPKGFAVDVNDLDTIANVYLPQAADSLRAPIRVITAHEGLEGPGTLSAMYPMEDEYAAFTQSIGNQQRVGCARIDATIEALREIVALYRRVDGQR